MELTSREKTVFFTIHDSVFDATNEQNGLKGTEAQPNASG